MALIRALSIALALAAGACAADTGEGDADLPEPIECGADTCGAEEYCVNECLCCGIPTDAAPSSRTECRPIPEGCDPGDLCSCPSLSGSCDAERRVVDIPCA